MLICCAKPEEVTLWEGYAAAHGRSKSVILFDENQGFNFLEYELARQGMDGIGSVTECLMRVIEAARRAGATPGGAGDSFWQDATRMLLSYAIPAIYAATGTVSVSAIITFVTSCITDAAQLADDAITSTNHAYQILFKARTNPAVPIRQETIDAIAQYWFNQYTAIPDRTRGNIIITLTTALGRFNHGRLNRVFCGRTSVVPDMTFLGAIIILKMPALTWQEDGIIGQQLWKYMWQRATESRNGLPEKYRHRPVGLWCDEAQYFANSYDSDFLSTCRGSRAAVVFLSQNLPSYYAKMGQGETHAVDALIGKFNTHIFHQNADQRTGEFASHLIGRSLQRRATYSEGEGTNYNMGMNTGANTTRGTSSSAGGDGKSSSWSIGSNSGSGESWGDNRGRGANESYSRGFSEQMDYTVEPAWFARGLKSGGPKNGNQVTGVWFKSGGNFKAAESSNAFLAVFDQ
jgi:hypothetical protein